MLMKQRIGLVLISALFLTAAFPAIGWSLFAWIALIPFFYALRGLDFWQGFSLGSLLGLIHFCGILYWIGYPVTKYAHMSIFLAMGAVFLLSFILSIFIGVFGVAIVSVINRPALFYFGTPVFFLAVEYARSTFFSGFPWALLGASQYNQSLILQTADLFGVWGITFLLVLGNAAIFLMIESFRFYSRLKKQHEKSIFVLIFIFPLLLAAVIYYGHGRLLNIEKRSYESNHVRAAILQGNILPSLKWDTARRNQTMDKYIKLALTPTAQSADLIVLPETALAFQLVQEETSWSYMRAHIFPTKSWFVVGAPYSKEDKEITRYFNSAFLINPQGRIVDRYDKAHLVPFGEYSPAVPFGGRVALPGLGDFTPGEAGQILKTDKMILGPQICYEVIFPKYSRLTSQNGANILVNLTEDGWYGKTSGPYQHFSLTVLRAVENRRALIRAANTGFSGFVLPSGKVLTKSKLYEEAVLVADLPILKEKTVYQTIGDLLPQTCLVLLTIWFLFQIMIYSRQKKGCKKGG